MNNPNHANDKNRAPSCDRIDHPKQFRSKSHYLKSLLNRLKLTYEGFYRSQYYANTKISEQLQNEGNVQQEFYIQQFDNILLELKEISDEMREGRNTKIEGK